ncbi:hypothetical protein ACQJBY_064046 [Aegilops geniculata]
MHQIVAPQLCSARASAQPRWLASALLCPGLHAAAPLHCSGPILPPRVHAPAQTQVRRAVDHLPLTTSSHTASRCTSRQRLWCPCILCLPGTSAPAPPSRLAGPERPAPPRRFHACSSNAGWLARRLRPPAGPDSSPARLAPPPRSAPERPSAPPPRRSGHLSSDELAGFPELAPSSPLRAPAPLRRCAASPSAPRASATQTMPVVGSPPGPAAGSARSPAACAGSGSDPAGSRVPACSHAGCAGPGRLRPPPPPGRARVRLPRLWALFGLRPHGSACALAPVLRAGFRHPAGRFRPRRLPPSGCAAPLPAAADCAPVPSRRGRLPPAPAGSEWPPRASPPPPPTSRCSGSAPRTSLRT